MGDKNVPVGEIWVSPAGTPMDTFPDGWQLLGYHPNYIDSPEGDEE